MSMFLGGIVTDTPNVFTNASELLEQDKSQGKILTKLGTNSTVIRQLKYSPKKMFKMGNSGNSAIHKPKKKNPYSI